MVEYLTDRAVKSKSLNKKDSKFVSDLKIEDNKIYIKYLEEDAWFQLICVQHLPDKTIKDVFDFFDDDVFIPDDIKDNLSKIKRDIEFAWNEDIEKFTVDYNLNSFGQIHKLYIPTGGEYLNNIVIEEIYNECGDFVAHEIEENMKEPLYKIESMDLYVNNIHKKDRNLYFKKKLVLMNN